MLGVTMAGLILELCMVRLPLCLSLISFCSAFEWSELPIVLLVASTRVLLLCVGLGVVLSGVE